MSSRQGLSLVFFRNQKITKFTIFLLGQKGGLPLMVWMSPGVVSGRKSIIWSTFGSYSCAEYLVSPLTPGGRSNQGLHLQGKKLAITTVRRLRVIGAVCVRVSRWWDELKGGVKPGRCFSPSPALLQRGGEFQVQFLSATFRQKHGCHYHC